jgi:hypothetical protein
MPLLKKSIISILMVIVHSFLGSKYLHVHTFENFFSAHTRITKLIYYLYSEILNFCFQLRNHARNGACRSHWSTTGLILYGWPNKNFELNIIDMRKRGLEPRPRIRFRRIRSLCLQIILVILVLFTGTRIPDPFFPHLVPPAIMVWIFVWKYICEPLLNRPLDAKWIGRA